MSEVDNPSEKDVIVEEEQNRADGDDVGNLEDLPKFVLAHRWGMWESKSRQ